MVDGQGTGDEGVGGAYPAGRGVLRDVFSHGTFMPWPSAGALVDRSLRLPPATSRSFWLHGTRWEIPGPNNADVFVDRLVRADLLVHDPVAAAAVVGDVGGLSTRSVERRVARATGLTRGTIRQIRRAEKGVELLSLGMAPLDVARLAGYADQAHMTRSLRRFVGQTPSGIASPAAGPQCRFRSRRRRRRVARRSSRQDVPIARPRAGNADRDDTTRRQGRGSSARA